MLRASFHRVQQVHTRYESSSTGSFHHHSLASFTTYFRVGPDAVVHLNNQCLSPFLHAFVGRRTSPSWLLKCLQTDIIPGQDTIRHSISLSTLLDRDIVNVGPCEQQFRWCDGGYSSLRSATERGDES